MQRRQRAQGFQLGQQCVADALRRCIARPAVHDAVSHGNQSAAEGRIVLARLQPVNQAQQCRLAVKHLGLRGLNLVRQHRAVAVHDVHFHAAGMLRHMAMH